MTAEVRMKDALAAVGMPAPEVVATALDRLTLINRAVPKIGAWKVLIVDEANRPVEGWDDDNYHWVARAGVMVRLAQEPARVNNAALFDRVTITDAVTFPLSSGVGIVIPTVDDWRQLEVDSLNRPMTGTKKDGTRWRASAGAMIQEGGGASVAAPSLKQTWTYNRLTGSAALAAGQNVDYLILIVGQSLAEGASAVTTDVALTTTPEHPGYALMPAPHVYPNGAAFTAYADLKEAVKAPDWTKETIASGMADAIMRKLNTDLGFKPRIVFAVAAKGGNAYYGSQTDANGGLKRGSATYAEALRIAKQCKAITEAAGRTLIIPGVVAVHGEQDHTDGRTEGLYGRAISNWSATLGDDLAAITGQSDRVRWYVTQVNRTDAARARPRIAQAQLDVQARDPNVRMIGPIYFGDQSGDNSHPAPRTYRRMGQMAGAALAADLFGPYYEALFVREAWWQTTTTIRLKFTAPIAVEATDDLVVISTLGAGKGVTFDDGSGSIPSVTGIAVVSGATDTLEVTLSAAPTGKNQRVFIATQQTGGPGRVGGARSGIRSATSFGTDPQDSAVLYHWACQQAVTLPTI